MLLYTYATQRPIGTRTRSLHVGTPAHVYTLPTAGSLTYARIGRYATVPARAHYTWAHPPTCAPYTAVRFVAYARAPVVILQVLLLEVFFVLLKYVLELGSKLRNSQTSISVQSHLTIMALRAFVSPFPSLRLLTSYTAREASRRKNVFPGFAIRPDYSSN